MGAMTTTIAAPDPLRRESRGAAAKHPALEAGHCALLLGPLEHRQHHVGHGGGLGKRDVADDEQGCGSCRDLVEGICGWLAEGEPDRTERTHATQAEGAA